MKPILILYHKNCPDGFGAAWAARKKFGNKAEYLGVDHRFTPKEKFIKTRKEIYTLDFCYSQSILKKLLKINPNIAVIDHHITSKEIIKSAKNYFYALNHSGSVLSWMYFHSKKPVPRLLQYIEDVDLWKWKLPFSAEISVALELYNNFDFKKWDKIAPNFEDAKKIMKYVNEGKLILKYRGAILKRILGGVEKVKFEKQKAYVINSPVWQSEIGNYIVKNKKAIGIVWSRKSGKINVSLRSNGKIDVSKLAFKHGGGGHKAASGFTLDVEKPFPWK